MKYQSVPMSLADACLVRMSELHSNSYVFTMDSDFNLYRKNGRQVIPSIMPG
jgi:predicted nucleic acid-binding protein